MNSFFNLCCLRRRRSSFLGPVHTYFFFLDTASVRTHLTDSTANPDIFKSALQSGQKLINI